MTPIFSGDDKIREQSAWRGVVTVACITANLEWRDDDQPRSFNRRFGSAPKISQPSSCFRIPRDS
jgi:hypothetical protein